MIALECTLPIVGGVVGFVRGLASLLAARSRAAELGSFLTQLPVTPIAKARQGNVARVRGRIVSPPTVRSFLADKVVALASVMAIRSVSKVTVAFAPKGFGADLEIEDESGAARLDLGPYRLFGDVEWAGPAPSSNPVVRAALERAYPRFAQASGRFWIKEIALERGDVVEVIGRVVGVEETEAPSGVSYRELDRARRITMSKPDQNGALLVTTFDQQEFAALIADARRAMAIASWQIALGVANVAVGAALVWWFLR